MKVICIDENYEYKDGIEPLFGEIVTASQCEDHSHCYAISEYPRDKQGIRQSFKKNHFALLSNIDETTFKREIETTFA